MVNLPPEKLGSFYLGARYDIDKQKILNESVNYDARDLTTHAVCVGMTGSGKTGLCIGLLEEAAIDRVPAIIIDPKGDMTNLLLKFENLTPEEFGQWINPDDASRKGMSTDDYAVSMAEKWKNGLADWGQDKSRIKALKESVDYTIYTPGSNAGVPINIMGSFAAPKVDFDSDAEMLRERIQGIVAALLGMLNKKVDPTRSREGILLANIFEHYWKEKLDLDLGILINSIQKPPMSKLGVFDVDTFFPEKDRFELAMDFNSLVASPQFQYWLQGEALDIEKIYFTPDGKPRHSIFYIAHLSESERMFFVTLLLNSLITWMRRQSGTSSLRSLLYFDEIFGYFPPTENPPSKKPLLTILKQARAFGVGAVLVTQNPVDIDYKGLSNAGTWFIGKLQTDRDKMRVLDGLKGAIAEAGSSNDLDFDKIITGLGSRVFLLHNVHEGAPIVYHTRWAMSYLRGPLTRPQVKELMKQKKEQANNPESKIKHSAKASNTASNTTAPAIDPSVLTRYFAAWKSPSQAAIELNSKASTLKLVYEPGTFAAAKVRFYDSRNDIDEIKEISIAASSPDDFGRVNWDDSVAVAQWERVLLDKVDQPNNVSVEFATLPDTINSAKELKKVEDEFENWIYQNKRIEILVHKGLKLTQGSEESKEAFMMRIEQAAKENRDEEIDELQEKYAPKFERIEDKIRKEEQDLAEAEADAKHRQASQLINVAETIFSVFVKKRSRSFSSVASKNRMSRKAKQKVQESKEDLIELDQDFSDLENELETKLQKIKDEWANIFSAVETKEIGPRKTDIKVDATMVAWTPYWVNENGERVSAR